MPFSSPEPKAQVRFSDQTFSVFCRQCRRSRIFFFFFFTFKSFCPEPLVRLQTNLEQSFTG